MYMYHVYVIDRDARTYIRIHTPTWQKNTHAPGPGGANSKPHAWVPHTYEVSAPVAHHYYPILLVLIALLNLYAAH